MGASTGATLTDLSLGSGVKLKRLHAGLRGPTMNRPVAFLIWVLFFVVTAMIVGSILSFIAWDVRRYLGYVAVPVAVLWFLWSWLKWHTK
jgi:hypothetical protein